MFLYKNVCNQGWQSPHTNQTPRRCCPSLSDKIQISYLTKFSGRSNSRVENDMSVYWNRLRLGTDVGFAVDINLGRVAIHFYNSLANLFCYTELSSSSVYTMQSFVRITDMVTALGVWLCVASIAQAAKVHYTLDLSWRNGAPNGVSRNMIFVNGEFPGPPLILDEGDDVTVCALIHGTIMQLYVLTMVDWREQLYAIQHEHPFPWNWVSNVFLVDSRFSLYTDQYRQAGTPWSDGVSGLTQWGIQPGESFTYKWNANTYGTYWYVLLAYYSIRFIMYWSRNRYHSHDMDTIQDGLYGAIHIR